MWYCLSAAVLCCALAWLQRISGEWAIVEQLKQEYVLMPAKGACVALFVCHPGGRATVAERGCPPGAIYACHELIFKLPSQSKMPTWSIS